MRKLVPKISVVGWVAWTLAGAALLIVYPRWSSWPFAVAVLDFGVKGAGIALSILLVRRTQRGLVFLLTGVCLFALWRFFLVDVVYRMHPTMGGLSFGASLMDWWQRTASSALRAILIVPFVAFATVSLIFWPFYGLVFESQSNDSAA